MSIITFDESLGVAKFTFGYQRRDLSYSSPFGSQSVGVNGPLWVGTLAQANVRESNSGPWKVLAIKLAGKVDQLALWDMMRPEPLGTLRGTLTFKGAHAANATSLVLSGGAGQAGATVLAGDYFGMGSSTTQQVVMAMADAVADGSGDITIDISKTPLRNAFSNGDSVTWNKPKALFRHMGTRAVWEYGQGKVVSGLALDLVEDWRP